MSTAKLPELPPVQKVRKGDKLELVLTRPETRHMADDLMAHVAAERSYALRMSDAGDLEKRIAQFTLATMREPIAELAKMVHFGGGGRRLFAGGNIALETVPCEQPHLIRLLVSHKSRPGAYLWDIAFSREYTQEAQDLINENKKAQREECDALGLRFYEYFLRDVFKKELSEIQKEGKRIERDKSSYMDMHAGSKPNEVSIRSISSTEACPAGIAMFGMPRAVGKAFSAAPLSKIGSPKGGYDGIALISDHDISRGLRGISDEEYSFDTRLSPSGLLAPPLMTISEVIYEIPELAAMAASEAEAIASTACTVYGSDALKEELAIALSLQDGGLFGPACMFGLTKLQHITWAQDIETRLEEFDKTAERLLQAGYDRPDNRYDCNDMRDECWAERSETGWTIHGENQNTHWKMTSRWEGGERMIDLTGRSGKAEGERTVTFAVSESGLSCLDGPNRDSLRLVWNMNGAISSLDSISCCLEEDLELKAENGSEP